MRSSATWSSRRPTFVDIAPLSVERFDAAALRPEYNIV